VKEGLTTDDGLVKGWCEWRVASGGLHHEANEDVTTVDSDDTDRGTARRGSGLSAYLVAGGRRGHRPQDGD